MNHLCVSLSYLMCGSEVPDDLTDVKRLSVVVFSAPSVPDLSKTFILPLPLTNICVGPQSPLQSGGINPDSDNFGPAKLNPTVCGASLSNCFGTKLSSV